MSSDQQKGKSFFNNKRRAGAMRKTILRNPELPLSEFPPLPHVDLTRAHSSHGPSTSQRRSLEDQENNKPSSFKYHEPKLNNANDVRQKLAEITQYRDKTLDSLRDLTIGTRKAVNKEVGKPYSIVLLL